MGFSQGISQSPKAPLSCVGVIRMKKKGVWEGENEEDGNVDNKKKKTTTKGTIQRKLTNTSLARDGKFLASYRCEKCYYV